MNDCIVVGFNDCIVVGFGSPPVHEIHTPVDFNVKHCTYITYVFALYKNKKRIRKAPSYNI